jgi:hypothetical protein
MTRHVLWIGAFLTVAIGLSWWGLRRAPQRSVAGRTPIARERDQPIADQVEALQRTTRDLQARLDRAEALASSKGPAPASSGGADEGAVVDEADAALARLKPKERDQLLVTSTLELLEDVVSREAPDARWSRDAAVTLSERLSTPEFAGTRASSIDCAQSVCRFRLQHETVDARERFQPALGSAPLRGNLFFHYDGKKNETVVYVAREGQTLPPADLREAAMRLDH